MSFDAIKPESRFPRSNLSLTMERESPPQMQLSVKLVALLSRRNEKQACGSTGAQSVVRE
jgi:hypothetical protein